MGHSDSLQKTAPHSTDIGIEKIDQRDQGIATSLLLAQAESNKEVKFRAGERSWKMGTR